MNKIILFIFFFSLFGNNEPFYNYKHDKVYEIINNGLIPLIDGKLNDSCWLNVEDINSFTQLEPNYNNIPTENTVVKIIQDDYALYISAQLYDKSPSLIAQKYVNRDDFPSLSKSDWFSISIDSHHDHQTAYNFTVNAAGVQFDSFLFDDTDEEMNWDGIWQSMVSTDDNGWNVEMRIPFSSLRFSDIKKDSEWGIDIHRYIHRKNEDIDWVVLPKGTSAGVSKFGHLRNIKNIENERTIEVMPYISMGQMSYDDILLNDLNKEKEDYHSYNTTFYYPKIGLDIKVHLSNNTIVDLTTFPDFGQIESDPADINFTYYDTYFEEKRNFFLENITLFDTPIDLFHSRRIGENPDYEINQYENSKEALVLGAAKVTGKTESDISYGLITATTMGQIRSTSLLDFDGPTHNYLIGRLSKDILAGNSYIGITGTNFNNSERRSSVISYDGLYYLFNNRLFIDSQLIYSMSEGINGLGAFLEFEYSIPNLVQLGSSLEYYDKNLSINDIGYLIRNDLFKLNTKAVYHNDKMLLNLGVRDFSAVVNHIFSKNNDDYLLSNIFNSMFSLTFTNYSFLDISHRLSLESYEDRLYVFTEDTLYMDKIGKTPSSNTFQIDFGNDPTDRLFFDCSFTNTKTDLGEKGNKYFLLLGANVTEDSDVSMSFLKIAGNEKFRFLDPLLEEIENDLGTSTVNHFIFSNSKNINNKFTFRYNKFFQNGVNIQLYHEYFTESHLYNNYSELTMDDGVLSDYPSSNTEYIIDNNFYCLPGNIDDECSIDPNYYIYHFPNYNELNFNLILSWEYSKKSSIYFIYKIRKAIVGHDIADYMDFINHKHSDDLSEIWKDQAVYVKMDYWFDF